MLKLIGALVVLGILGVCGIICLGIATVNTTSGGATARSVAPEGGSDTGQQAPECEMGETLNVGYTSYCVWRAWYSNRLSKNQYLDKRPNARWLFVDLTVRNNDTKARMIPPLKLIDENGAEYESSPAMIEGTIGILESLNPSVKIQGLVVFDVPDTRDYRLKVSGGFWSADDGLIRIVPGKKP